MFVDWRGDPPELQNLFVAEQHRRRGVGAALVRALEERVAAAGHRRLTLTTSSENASAIEFFERFAYERTADPPERVQGTIQIRGRPVEVDDTLLRFERKL